MSVIPYSSPWGEVQHSEKLIDGVFLVSTASHGGVMVRKNAFDFLSSEARKIALNERNYLCFEEDCDEAVVIRELLDKKLWDLPNRITDKAGYEDSINRSLVRWHPEYWETRQKTLPAQPTSAGTELDMPDARKDIIFRDADYKEMFRIKDGDNIKITVAYDGEELIRKCRWIDEAHMNVGSTPYHMDEFMEKLTRVGNKFEPIPGQEPKIDVVIVELDGKPYDATIPMKYGALRSILGSEPKITQQDKSSAVLEGKSGNGSVIVCGVSDGNITSLHPYVAQTRKRDLAARAALSEDRSAQSLAGRLEAGKVKAAAHISDAGRTASKQRHAEMG